MRVNQGVSPNVPESGKSGTTKGTRAADRSKAEYNKNAERTGGTRSGDVNTEISPRAKQLSQAKAAAQNAPDVREERIAELKAKIQKGEYSVSPDKVAERMIQEHQTTGDASL